MNDSKQYYVTARDKKKVLGPVTLTQITTALKEGKLKPTHIASLSLNGPWQSLEEMFSPDSKNKLNTDDSASTVKTKKKFSVLHILRLCLRLLAFIPGLRICCRFFVKLIILTDFWLIFKLSIFGVFWYFFITNWSSRYTTDPYFYLSLFGPPFAAFCVIGLATVLEDKSYEEIRREIVGAGSKKGKLPFDKENVEEALAVSLSIGLLLCLGIGAIVGIKGCGESWENKAEQKREREIEIIKEGVKRALEESK